MSERGRARGRGRSRPAVPSDDGSAAPSGAAGATASSAEVKQQICSFDFCSITNEIFSLVSFHQQYHHHHQLQQLVVLVLQPVIHPHPNGQLLKQHLHFNKVIFVVLVVEVR